MTSRVETDRPRARPGSSANRPLWQILFGMSFAAFAAARVLVDFALGTASADPALLLLCGLVLLGSAVIFIGVWTERPWPVAALTWLVGGLLGVNALLQAGLGLHPFGQAMGEVGLIAVLAGGLGLALRHGGGAKHHGERS